MTFTILAIGLALLVIIFVSSFQRIHTFWRIVSFSRKCNGPKAFEFARNAAKDKLLPYFVTSNKKYGSRYSTWLGKDFVMFITDPADMRIVLSSQEILYKSKFYEILQPWLGEGLLISGGSKWQKARKFLTPAFHFNILKQFQSTMNDCGEIMVEKLRKHADGSKINIYPFVTLYALDVISETAMGIKINAQMNMDSIYVRAVQGICEIINTRSFNPLLRINFIYKFSALKRKQDKLLKILHGETYRVIEERRQHLLAKKTELKDNLDHENVYLSSKNRFAFLDMILMAQMEGKEISDLQIREEVDTFMFEGHDTTSSAISFALYLLSSHIDVQTLAYEEAEMFMGNEQEPMKYLEAVIKETLRLYPSVPFYGRKLYGDFQLGDILLPKGVILGIVPFAMHRDPKLFPDPLQFKPERFLDEESVQPFSYMPFSAGPRNCIGQKFAMLEMKCILAKLLRAFEFQPANVEPIVISEVVLKSNNGVHLKIVARKMKEL